MGRCAAWRRGRRGHDRARAHGAVPGAARRAAEAFAERFGPLALGCYRDSPEGEAHEVQFDFHVAHGAENVEAAPAIDDGDGGQLPVDHDELDERALAERVRDGLDAEPRGIDSSMRAASGVTQVMVDPYVAVGGR